MLDGELVVLRRGRPDFHALMSRHARRVRGPFFAEPVHYVIFDVLYWQDRCLKERPLAERRAVLDECLPELPLVSRARVITSKGNAFFREVVAAGHEGVVAKKLTSRYLPNRRVAAWRKIKQKMELPWVVIGYRTGADGLKELLLATLAGGVLTYAGAVELGIPKTQETFLRLQAARITGSAVPCSLRANWVRPEIFCTVRFCGYRPGVIWRDAVIAGWDQ